MWDQITRFAGDRLTDFDKAKHAVTNEMKWAAKQLRDQVAVPALDTAMEAGVVPATQGMAIRWASGTETPLTKTPKDLREAIPAAVKKAKTEGTRQVEGFQQVHGDVHGDWKGPLQNSLGAFWANPQTGEVEDAYDFSYYDPKSDKLHHYTGGIKSGIDMLRSGEERGMIPIAHELGLVKPGHSYPIRFNYKK